MKTPREALDDAYNEIWGSGKFQLREHEVLQRHLAPLLTPPPDTRKAEVARIAEAMYIRCMSNPQFAMTNVMGSAACFADAEAFVTYKESMK